MKPFMRSHRMAPRRRIRTGLLLASTAMTFAVAGTAAAVDLNGVVTHTVDYDYADTLQVGVTTSGAMVVENGADVRNTYS